MSLVQLPKKQLSQQQALRSSNHGSPNSALVEPFQWPLQPESDPPRALKTLARIIENDLCHRCGSCVGICPTKVLGCDEEDYPIVNNLSACTDCDLCVKVCPGDKFDVKSVAQQMFGFVPDLSDMHGHFEAAYLSYATDPNIRSQSTSGGLITALLISMLKRGEIDGALVVSSDPDTPWRGKPIIARTPEAILGSTKSKYAIAPTNIVFEEIRKVDGSYAIVGLPCQIHGFHKAARLDRRLRDRVKVTIGLFCHAAVEHEPLKIIWDSLGDKKPHVKRFISRVGKHPGTPHVELNDGTLEPVYFPNAKSYRPSSMEMINILYRLYTPPRCLTCYDSTSEYADIAVGDPWMASPADDINFTHGYSFTLARTERGKQALDRAATAADIVVSPLKADLARTSNTMMGEEKRWRAFRIIETRRRQGHSVPDYGFETPRASGKHLIFTEFNMMSHIFCFIKRGRKQFLKLMLSPVGYSLLWTNNKKRRFREWRRDQLARWRRRAENSHV